MNFCLEVAGDYACFTRPEMKMERVSYDVITPSAARAVFEAILWKPAIQWVVNKIEVLQPIQWLSLRRNEVASKMSTRNAQSMLNGTLRDYALYVEDDRQQRATLLLRDVRYRLHAALVLTKQAGPEDSEQKFIEMFRRRASKGQCLYQPYLGCREFSCSFRLVDGAAEQASPIQDSRDLGFMLYDLDFTNVENPVPLFFRASMEQGIIQVPPRQSSEVRG